MFKQQYKLIFTTIILISHINLYSACIPGDPGCSTTTTSTTTTSSSSNRSYTNQGSLLSTIGNYATSLIGLNGSSSSNDTNGSSSKASIAIAYVNTNDTSVTMLPIGYDYSKSLSFDLTLSYVNDKLNGNKGFGDTSLGVAYKFGTNFKSNKLRKLTKAEKDFNYIKVFSSLSIPNGQSELSLDYYTSTVGIEFSRNINPLDIRLYFSYSYNTIVGIPEFNLADVVSYSDKDIEYGDKNITILGYDQLISEKMQLNLKYLILDADSTVISSVDQNDYASYQDLSIGVSLNLQILALKVGILIPTNDSYGPGFTSSQDRNNTYYISLGKTF